jgi:hypothetical protein
VDDDGKPAGVKAALESLKKDKPGLFGAPGVPGTAGPKPAGGATAEKLREETSQRLGKLKYRM